MKLVKLGMVCGALLLAACGGEDGATGATGPAGPAGPAGNGDGGGASVETINGITPARSYVGRTVHMTISGDNTNWTTAPAVTFDDAKMTAENITVASPTAIVLDVVIADGATVGDKVITVGGQTYKGFRVENALAGSLTGTQAQGSVLFYDVTNADSENLFDGTTDANGAFTRIQLGDLGDGVNGAASSVQPQSASFQILIDADAVTGAHPITIASGLNETSFSGAETLTVEARAPKALVAGSNAVSLAPAASDLFVAPALTGTKGSYFGLSSPTNPDLLILDLTASGSWADFSTFASGFVNPGGAASKIVIANFAAAATTAPLEAITLPLNARVEAEPNETNLLSTAIADLNEGIYGDFASNADVDTYKVVLAAPTRLRVITAGIKSTTVNGIFGPQQVISDTVVEIIDNIGDSVIESDDADYGEDVTTEDQLAAGTYYVKVTLSSPGSYQALANDYAMFLIAVP